MPATITGLVLVEGLMAAVLQVSDTLSLAAVSLHQGHGPLLQTRSSGFVVLATKCA